jgi:TetR/AcrR family transcriptional regulator, tetracycline repressor protein
MYRVHVRSTVNTYGVQLSSVSPGSNADSRPKLDRAVVIDTGLGVADAEGLEAVTIRRLAQELSVTPMALYWHFKDKDGLLASMADRIWEGAIERFDAAGATGGSTDLWSELRRVLDAVLGAMREHPAVGGLVPFRVMSSEAGLVLADRTLALLADLGFDREMSSHVAQFLLNGAVMLVGSQPGVEVADAEARAEVQRQKLVALAALPPGRFPHISESAVFLTDCESPEGHFEVGAALLVGGIQHQASLLARSPA